jgi:hypothetical protein
MGATSVLSYGEATIIAREDNFSACRCVLASREQKPALTMISPTKAWMRVAGMQLTTTRPP